MSRRWTWIDHAACGGDDWTVWIEHPSRVSPAELEQARQICRTCPVLAQCTTWASTDPNFQGVAAGRLYPVTDPAP